MRIKTPEWKNLEEVTEFIIRNGLEEDASIYDVTTSAFGNSMNRAGTCLVVARKPLVLAGWPVLEMVFVELGKTVKTESLADEGSAVEAGTVVGRLYGPAGIILRGERISLNLLCRLSGIATLTRSFVERVKGTGVDILDTRKTQPGMRILERYAVSLGGGVNHRFDLAEMAMIKDNHIAVAGKELLESVIKRIRQKKVKIEIEVDDVKDLRDVLELKPERILLDNMTVIELEKAVRIAKGSGCYLEASGGVTLETIRKIAETGINGISVGALTHSAGSVDMGFDWQVKQVQERI